MPNIKDTKNFLLGPQTHGYLFATNTLASLIRHLAEKSRSYRKTRDITVPMAAQFSAFILEQKSLLSSNQLLEIQALLVDWKVKEAPQKPFDFSFHPDGHLLTEIEKILQQLANFLVTAVSEEHGLAVKAGYRRGRVHGSRDSFEFQLVEQAKAEVIKRIHKVTGKVREILGQEAGAIQTINRLLPDDSTGSEIEEWRSELFRDFNEKEFEVAMCAVLQVEKLTMEKEFLRNREQSLYNSVIETKQILRSEVT